MRVLAYDPFAPPPAEVACTDLDELVAASDVLTLHVPLTAENHHLVERRVPRPRPSRAPSSINCGRGGLLDLDAALAALESGQLVRGRPRRVRVRAPGAPPDLRPPRACRSPRT